MMLGLGVVTPPHPQSKIHMQLYSQPSSVPHGPTFVHSTNLRIR